MTKQEEQTIAAQIRERIKQELEAGRAPHAAWLTQAVVGEWEPPSGRDADMWTQSGYANVRALVREVVRSYKPPENENEDDRQLVLEGYERLHKAYLISRNNEQTIVRVDQLTVAEALGIIEDLMRCERGLRLHIHEMQKYIDEVLIPRERRQG